MLGLIFNAATLCVGQVPPAAKMGIEEEARKPKLIVKGKDYFIHALPPAAYPSRPAGLGLFQWSDSTACPVVLHTVIGTGEMKILAASQASVKRGLGMAIETVCHYRTGIAGVAADKQRLYILEWHADWETMLLGQLRMQASLPDVKDVKYRLLVFRPDTGKVLHRLELKEGDFPKILPQQTVDRGPLQLRDDGVVCFGVIFTFEGTRLVKQQYQKKR